MLILAMELLFIHGLQRAKPLLLVIILITIILSCILVNQFGVLMDLWYQYINFKSNI